MGATHQLPTLGPIYMKPLMSCVKWWGTVVPVWRRLRRTKT